MPKADEEDWQSLEASQMALAAAYQTYLQIGDLARHVEVIQISWDNHFYHLNPRQKTKAICFKVIFNLPGIREKLEVEVKLTSLPSTVFFLGQTFAKVTWGKTQMGDAIGADLYLGTSIDTVQGLIEGIVHGVKAALKARYQEMNAHASTCNDLIGGLKTASVPI